MCIRHSFFLLGAGHRVGVTLLIVQLPEMGLVQDPRKPCQCSTPCLGLTEASLKTKSMGPVFKKASPTAKWAVYQRTPEVMTLWVSGTHLVSAPTSFSRPMPRAPSSYQHFLPLALDDRKREAHFPLDTSPLWLSVRCRMSSSLLQT